MATIVGSAAGGTWSTTGAWVGGVVPTAADDVQLDATTGNITLAGSPVCRSLDCTGYTGTLNVAASIIIGTSTPGPSNLALKLVNTMTVTGSSTFLFNSTSATQQTITTGGRTLNSMTINAVGGSYLLSDNLTMSQFLTLTNGSLDTNNVTLSLNGFTSTATSTRSLTLGTSTITCINPSPWNFGLTGLTFSGASSTIIMTGASPTFTGAGLSYGTVSHTGSGTFTIAGSNTFVNLSRTGTAAKTDAISLTTATTQTVTGTFTVAGNSVVNRMLVRTTTPGIAATISAGTVTASNADFQDIVATGAASWNLAAITGNSGDASGNTGITFTSSTTQTATGTASFTWSTHGWTSRVPLPQDDVIVANAFIAGRTVTMDMPRIGRDVDMSGATGSPTITPSSATTVTGSLSLAATMTVSGTQSWTFMGRGTHTVDFKGLTLGGGVTFNGTGSSHTLTGALTTTNGAGVALAAGDLNTNGQTITAQLFSITGSIARSLSLGASVFNLSGTSTIWNNTATGTTTVNPGTSEIVLTTATATGRSINLNGSDLGTITYAPASSSTGTLTIQGPGTIQTLNASDVSASRIIQFTVSTTTSIRNLNVVGKPGALITLKGASATKATLTKIGAGLITGSDYINVSNFTATPASTWYAGANSVDGGNNTGWIFSAPPAASATQSATARISATPVATQTATAAIKGTVSLTQTAIARLSRTFTKTQSAIARIARKPTKTQTATANIVKTFTKTQPATARISKTLTKTQPTTARIAATLTKTQSAVASILLPGVITKTQGATARITASVTKTQTAVGRIARIYHKPQTSDARIGATFTKTQSAVASIAVPGIGQKTQSAAARIAKSFTNTQTSIARLSRTPTKTQTAVARLLRTVTKTQTATATVIRGVTYTKTQTALATLRVARSATQRASARIAVTFFYFQPPATDELPRTLGRPGRDDRFWSRIRRGKVGSSVIKNQDGTYVSLSYPTQDQIATATAVYMGGHVHPVTQAEAISLRAAGYTVTEVVA